MFKKIIFVGVLIALLFPLINLFVDKPVEIAPEALEGKTPLFQKAAPVIQESCLTCHSSHTQLPWYASLPIAKQIISNNIEEAREEVLGIDVHAAEPVRRAHALHVRERPDPIPVRLGQVDRERHLMPHDQSPAEDDCLNPTEIGTQELP